MQSPEAKEDSYGGFEITHVTPMSSPPYLQFPFYSHSCRQVFTAPKMMHSILGFETAPRSLSS